MNARVRRIQQTQSVIVGIRVGVFVHVVAVGFVIGGGADIEHEHSVVTGDRKDTLVHNASACFFGQVDDASVVVWMNGFNVPTKRIMVLGWTVVDGGAGDGF